MDCETIKELISAYVDGETSPEEARRIEEHLGACPECALAAGRFRALGVAAARTETEVSAHFRDRLFARMEQEGLLRRRRSLFAFSLRWAAVPLAAAAALGLFLLTSREAAREPAMREPAPAATRHGTEAAPAGGPAAAEDLSAEEREIVAYIDLLEDPQAFEEPEEAGELEIFLPSGSPREQG